MQGVRLYYYNSSVLKNGNNRSESRMGEMDILVKVVVNLKNSS